MISFYKKIKNLSKFKSLKHFLKKNKNAGGRNHHGRITVRHHGGGHPQKYRFLDWKRLNSENIVINFEYDPNRNTYIAKLYNKDSFYSYIIPPKGLSIFDMIRSIIEKKKNMFLKEGDHTFLGNFEIGEFVHQIEYISGKGAQVARSAGTFGQILQVTSNGLIKIKLPSGHYRLFHPTIFAVKGITCNEHHLFTNLGKAGRARWLNRRPAVRGVAMNPVDHPHGGGQGKTKGGRPSVTPQAWPTKGQPTRNKRKKNKLIIF